MTELDPVVRRPIIAYSGLNFNPGFFFVRSKSFPRMIFFIPFREYDYRTDLVLGDAFCMFILFNLDFLPFDWFAFLFLMA